MYNQDFLDMMDSINTLAQSMGHTNGIAWARSAVENNRLSEYDFKAFENCHHLRNSVAHGSARDINISAETMQIASVFYETIQHPNSASASQSVIIQDARRTEEDLQVQVGDYVIAMEYTNHGTLFQVIRQDSMDGDLLKNLETGSCCYIEELRGYDTENGLYVIRKDLSCYVTPRYAFYVAGKPVLKQGWGSAGIATIKIASSNDYDPRTVESIEVPCYLAHENCFKYMYRKPLYSMRSGELMRHYLNTIPDLPF